MTTPETRSSPKVCLSIAGLDPSGGAGILIDVKTFMAFGCYGAAAVTSVTFQNTVGVFGAEHQMAESVRRQVEPIFDDITVDAVKTGMLPTEAVIVETARMMRSNGVQKLVVDPVVRSTSGFDLIDNAALRAMVEHLFPLAAIVTPNLPEAERLTGIAIETVADIVECARIIRSFGVSNVLIKGGHFDGLKSASRRATDHLFMGEKHIEIDGEYHETTATHGTGCTLAAAITANLALGFEMVEAVEIAKRFVNDAIRNAPMIGKGHSPIGIRPISRSG
ncbi:bifunctional hydroxymethylpyrimidine kinase/phosphomethylpyrimidine kinase [soil metagenome]